MSPEDRVARRIKLRDLRLLEAVVRQGSMGRAAAELALSQAAVSKAVGEMENAVGAALLERSGRGVEPTRAALILIERSRAVFDELNEGLREIRALDDPNVGTVRIGTTEVVCSFVTETIGRLDARYPDIRYAMKIGDTDGLFDALRERELDVVVTRVPPEGVGPGLQSEPLFDAQMAVLASRDHPLARRRALRLADLLEERWTLGPPRMMLGMLVKDAFEREGLPVPVATVETLSIYARLTLVRTGRYLTMMPVVMIRHPINRPWLMRLPVKLPSTPGAIGIVRLARRKPSGAATAFWEAAKRAPPG